MSDYTPGPWRVIVGDNYSVRSEHTPNKYPHRFPGDDIGPIVALVGNRSNDFGEADARLIAAAPDLLEACRMLVESNDNGKLDDHMLWDAIELAQEAIAKATGANQ